MNLKQITKEKDLQSALSKYFGFTTFRSKQKEIINSVMTGNNTLVVMPTGAGKSLCFQLPAVIMDGLTIVISPLISLMKDQVDSLMQADIESAFYNSSQKVKEKQEVVEKILSDKLKILYISPETFGQNSTQELLSKSKISLIAVDEAHCISMWGHDFRPEYKDIGKLAKQFKVPIIALTATADEVTRNDIKKQLQLSSPQEYILSFLRSNLSIKVEHGIDRKEKILKFLNSKKDESGIIYCLSRKGTESLAKSLKQNGKSVAYYHAGMPTDKRESVQNDFSRDDIKIVCATIAFGMGIDKSNVRWIIHYNMPQSLENYYQEIGRAGRDGLPAETLLFSSLSDVMSLKRIIGNNSNNKVKISKLNRMYKFTESFTCRWKEILSYFGESLETDCKTCDICKNPPETIDGLIIAQKALSVLKRVRSPIQKSILSQILRGSLTKRITQFNYDKIKTFGKGADLSDGEWMWYIDQMITSGLININFEHYNTLQVTNLGIKALLGKYDVQFVKAKQIDDYEFKKEITSVKQDLEQSLFNELKILRKKIADKEDVPAFVIFNDKSLTAMAIQRPIIKSMFMNIEGVGEVKANKYGEQFTQEILHFIQFQYLQGNKIKGGSALVTLKFYKSGMTVEEIAQERSITRSTIFSHLIELAKIGFDIDFTAYITKDEITKVIKTIKKVGKGSVNKIKKELSSDFEYWKIRYVLEVHTTGTL